MTTINKQTSSVKLYNQVDDIISRWIFSMQVSESSRKSYRQSIQSFLKYCNEYQVKSIRFLDLLNYKKIMINTGLKPATINHRIITLKIFFKWTAENKIYKNIAKKLELVRDSRLHKKDALNQEQVNRILSRVKRQPGITGSRDSAIIHLAFYLGLREIEISRLRLCDIRNYKGKPCLFVTGKGQQTANNYMYIPGAALKQLERYLRARKKYNNQSVFLCHSNRADGQGISPASISRIGKELLISLKMKIPSLSFHSMTRHSAGSILADNEATAFEVQQFLRHKDIRTSMVYIHRAKRDKNPAEMKLADIMSQPVLA